MDQTVAVVGLGRVGSGAAQELLRYDSVDRILLIGRTEGKAGALKADLISAYPEKMDVLQIADYSQANEADVVLACAGLPVSPDQTQHETLRSNKRVVNDLLNKIDLQQNQKLVLVTSPVDVLTHYSQQESGLPTDQVIGFGGDLDLNRLKVVLGRSDIEGYILGEHGKRAIPFYEVNFGSYEEIFPQVRGYLEKIVKKTTDQPENRAAGILLARLTNSLFSEESQLHHVSVWNEEHQLYLTWPCEVSRTKVTKLDLDLPESIQRELSDLVKLRNEESRVV